MSAESVMVYWWSIEQLREESVEADLEKAPAFDWYYPADGKLVPWEAAALTRRQDGRVGAWLPTVSPAPTDET